MKKFFLLASLLIFFLIPRQIHAQDIKYLDVKIGNAYSQGNIAKISSDKNIYIVDKSFNKVMDLNVKDLNVSLKDKNITFSNGNNILYNNFPSDGSLLLKSDGDLKIGNTYRGYISFRIVANSIHVVNRVELEDYLKGVVPKELSAEYPLESLKAQAICSRSFALKNINKLSKYGYNLDDTTRCQVYKGKSAEEKRSSQAVDETRGLVAKYNNQIADTIFGASSGGRTANVVEVWGGKPVNYLSSFEDPYSKEYKWEYKLTKNDIKNKLNKSNINIGEFVNFNITDKDSSGRNKTIEIVGTLKTEKMSSNKFRSIFGNTKLKSTLFKINTLNDQVVFSGSGYGHGVGMSQYGAVNMAKKGKNYKEIIAFYFPGVTLQ